MAEASLMSNGTMAESDIIAMKETLLAQQQLLQKLHAELDEEREASATATSETVDMILRLQSEKEAVKMEAQQYERMAEEKLEHVETTLEIFEELMFQKDMEIASLENQVQAYKRKLVSLGCDPDLTEFELEENNNTDEHHHQNPENNESVRRLQSLPPLLFRYDSAKLMKILSTNMETKAHNSPNGSNNKIAGMLSRKMEGMSASLECNGEGEFHLLRKRIERLEKEREGGSSRQEIRHEGDGEEQLSLLKEILSQLKTIKEEIIISSEAKKSAAKEDYDGLLDPVNVEPVNTIHLHTPIRFYPLP